MGLRQAIPVWIIRCLQRLGPHRVEVLGRPFAVDAHVFNPRLFGTSTFLARNLDVGPGERVLDMGTGSGVLAVTAAAAGAGVVAVDCNPHATAWANRNAHANGVAERVAIVRGDLFGPFSPSSPPFDAILFNPPYMEGDPRSELDRALFDPGKKLIRRFLTEGSRFLRPGGRILLVYSTVADHVSLEAMARDLDWSVQVTARHASLFETFLVYRLTAGGPTPPRGG